MAEPYEPSEQDEIVGDAMAVGGPAFVEELHYAAMEAAEAVVAWDGNGDEPAAYRAIWVAFARKMVAERRLRLRPTGSPEETLSSGTENLSDRSQDAPGRSSGASPS
ncbi:hypothetical protein [Pseudonocardia sp. KRD291]|uniref:hypothetical protein n=1 Tax=Pseudonocardia sp. KRD291 TaxID=2792007 RepID=UPI001C4A5780|nr:hypothetical protein [Pseudonocardia sp. KRD291]MBW0105872.1 hypothetical protein [Pseudonocardia sp. KRD291]